MKTLKREKVDAGDYRSLAQARATIGRFIENLYNQQRRHLALSCCSSVELETSQPWAAARQPMASVQPSCP